MSIVSDFDRERAEYWFADACRKSGLLGGISYWANAPRDKTPYLRVTPTRALAEIRKLLAEYEAERAAAAATTAGGEAA